jgi:hypothetical protein
MEEKKETTEKKEKKTIQIIDVTTQTEKGFQLPNGDVVSLFDYLVFIGNKLLEIEKKL